MPWIVSRVPVRPVSMLLIAAQRRLSFCERQTSLGEEGLNQMRLLPEATDGEVELLVQLFEVAADQVAHLDMLEVVPPPFVPRVQVGGVARQGLQPDLAARLGHELRDLGPAV